MFYVFFFFFFWFWRKATHHGSFNHFIFHILCGSMCVCVKHKKRRKQFKKKKKNCSMSKSLLFWRNATQHSTISFFIFYAGQLNSWVFNIVSFYGAYILLTKNKNKIKIGGFLTQFRPYYHVYKIHTCDVNLKF